MTPSARPASPALALAVDAPSRRLIVTADDFGLSVAVNEAVELAFRSGILTSASLMVGAPATSDAVERARRLPSLAVGLHLALVRARPLLPPSELPTLVGPDGRLPAGLVRSGFRFFFRRAAREELEREVRAQFEAFRRTGLELDHVDAHNHMHVHPTVFEVVLRVGREHGLSAVRVPREPFLASWRAGRSNPAGRLAASLGLSPWIARMRRRLAREGLRFNDWIFGKNDTGRMTEDRVLRLIAELPAGVSEVYFHPATAAWPGIDPLASGYLFERELHALTSPAVSRALEDAGIERTRFAALGPARP
jgi:chitin disaccharide deacetylase